MEVFPLDNYNCQATPSSVGSSRVASPNGCVALRSALQWLVRTGGAPADVRRVVSLLCDEARRDGLHAEQLLVTLKAAWQSIPEVRRHPRGGRDELLDRIISACIQEFYARTPRGEAVGIARAD